MTTSDNLLGSIIKRVNESGALLDITITVGGAMITGKLAPRGAWLSTVAEQLEQTEAAKFASDFKAEGQTFDSEDYLHLSGGKVLFGTTPLPTHGGLIRVPTASVETWMIGRVGK